MPLGLEPVINIHAAHTQIFKVNELYHITYDFPPLFIQQIFPKRPLTAGRHCVTCWTCHRELQKDFA